MTADDPQASRNEFALAGAKIRIAPSLLAADFACLEDQMAVVEKAGAEVLHLDVMDGHFVPNISFGAPVIAALRKHSKMFFDAHLMIEQPQRYAESFVKAGCDLVTFHIEAADSPEQVVKHIRNLGASVGIALNPTTPMSAIESVIDSLDLVVVMSVWPGFGGQSFMPEVLDKVGELKKRLGSHQRLEIDGGVDTQTIASAAAAGADLFVAGTAVFRTPNPEASLHELTKLASEAATGDKEA